MNDKPEAVARPESYAEWQQKRGMLADAVDWAIHEYDEFMKDDAYDAQRVLDQIITKLRERRDILNSTETALHPEQPDASALVEAIVEAALDAANVVSHDGYYEIDRDAAVRAALAAHRAGNTPAIIDGPDGPEFAALVEQARPR